MRIINLQMENMPQKNYAFGVLLPISQKQPLYILIEITLRMHCLKFKLFLVRKLLLLL